LARSRNYTIEVEYDPRTTYSDDVWTVVVTTRRWLLSTFIGNKSLRQEPTDDEVLSLGRELIDEYLTIMDKKKPRKFNVRHP
jgi:hypothetical protein